MLADIVQELTQHVKTIKCNKHDGGFTLSGNFRIGEDYVGFEGEIWAYCNPIPKGFNRRVDTQAYALALFEPPEKQMFDKVKTKLRQLMNPYKDIQTNITFGESLPKIEITLYAPYGKLADEKAAIREIGRNGVETYKF